MGAIKIDGFRPLHEVQRDMESTFDRIRESGLTRAQAQMRLIFPGSVRALPRSLGNVVIPAWSNRNMAQLNQPMAVRCAAVSATRSAVDRFCEAMISIRQEIREIFARQWIASARSGWWYQTADGGWKQK